MQTERRSAPRWGLNSLVYLDLEPDNGGVLRNLSEDGMQISVANRLVTSSEIRFTLRLDHKETISGTGRVAWLSPSGRSAGVHFLSLPEEARRGIRQWMGVNADSSSAKPTEVCQEPAPDSSQTEAPAVAASATEPAPAVVTVAIVRVEKEEAEAKSPPSAPTEVPQIESPESSDVLEMQPAPEPAMETPEPKTSVPEPAVETAEPQVSTPEPAADTTEQEAFVTEPAVVVPEPEDAKEEAEAKSPPSAPTDVPQIESPESSDVLEMQPAPEPAMETPEPQASVPEPAVETAEPQASTPEPAADTTEQEAFVTDPADVVPEPEDALALLESTVETSEVEAAPDIWEPTIVDLAAPAIEGAGGPSSVLSLYGIDGQENISVQNPPEQSLEKTDERQPIAAAAYPQSWKADRPPHYFRIPDDRVARRARARARRKKATHKHPPILLSPIFVPAPPPSEFLPPPEPEKFYQPITAPAEAPTTQPLPAASAETSADAFLAPATMPEPPAETSGRQPGALYLPNYRIDEIAPVETPKTSWKDLFRKPKDFFTKPTPRLSDVFTRLEEFGWSLESDWHVWLSLILLLAGFLSLAQKPPLIVLTIAFWFASAVVISDRRRPQQRKHLHQKSNGR